VDFRALNESNDPEAHEDVHPYCWRPLAIRAELVRAGDVLIGRDGAPVFVVHAYIPPTNEGWSSQPDVPPKVELTVATRTGTKAWEVRPDYTVKILVPEPERAALIELRSQLGAQMIDRTGSRT
jgi:hypothetical protein